MKYPRWLWFLKYGLLKKKKKTTNTSSTIQNIVWMVESWEISISVFYIYLYFPTIVKGNSAALASVAGFAGLVLQTGRPRGQFPGRHLPGLRFGPRSGRVQKTTDRRLSHISVPPPPFLPPSPSVWNQ